MRRGSGSVVVDNHSRSGKVHSFKFDSKLDKSLIKPMSAITVMKGHWKAEFPRLQAKTTGITSYIKPAEASAPVT